MPVTVQFNVAFCPFTAVTFRSCALVDPSVSEVKRFGCWGCFRIQNEYLGWKLTSVALLFVRIKLNRVKLYHML